MDPSFNEKNQVAFVWLWKTLETQSLFIPPTPLFNGKGRSPDGRPGDLDSTCLSICNLVQNPETERRSLRIKIQYRGIEASFRSTGFCKSRRGATALCLYQIWKYGNDTENSSFGTGKRAPE